MYINPTVQWLHHLRQTPWYSLDNSLISGIVIVVNNLIPFLIRNLTPVTEAIVAQFMNRPRLETNLEPNCNMK